MNPCPRPSLGASSIIRLFLGGRGLGRKRGQGAAGMGAALALWPKAHAVNVGRVPLARGPWLPLSPPQV